MKKTILLTLMLAGMASAATTYTLDTAIVKTSDGTKVSAFEAALNKTATQANNVDGISGASHLGYTEANKPTITFTVQDMFAATALPGETLQLSTLSFLSRDDNSATGYDSVTLTVNGKSSTSSTFSIDSSAGANVYRSVTWTFNSPLVFTMDDTLSLTFTRGTTDVGMGAFTQETGYTYGGTNKGYTNNSTDYYNFFRMGVEVIPEPTTATLSLLALAGLAARRRRK